MKIYTGRGDDGLTDLRDMTRVSKTNPRIAAYGTVDEANALIGTLIPTEYDDVDERLQAVQNHLHIVQADFADPNEQSDGPRLEAEQVETIESWIDEYDAELEPLESFILPGGSDHGSRLHHARTVVRRAERKAVDLASNEAVNEPAITYLNRLSDLLFVMARVVNDRNGVTEHAPTY